MKNDVGIIGLGAWGAALAHHLTRKGFSVVGGARDEKLLRTIDMDRIHPKLKSSIPYPSLFSTSSDINSCWNAKTVIIAVPARALKEIALTAPEMTNRIVISAIKGLEVSTSKTPLQFLSSLESFKQGRLGVASGPSFASDVAEARPVSLVTASFKLEDAKEISEIFSSPTMRAYASSDTIGVELGGIVKNILAIAAGASDALGFGASARAGLITRGLAEMIRLATPLGAKQRTLSGLSGLGDLIMTATDDQSRNRRVGLKLGAGESIDHILKTLGSEAEGAIAAPLMADIAKKLNVEMPITEVVVKLIRGEIKTDQLAKALLSRPLKEED